MSAASTAVVRHGSGPLAARLAAALLFGITVVAMFAVAHQSPMVGYANNYGFVRQSACVGVWQQYPDRDKTQANPGQPVDALRYDGDRRRDVCLSSVDNVFPALAAWLQAPTREFRYFAVSSLRIAALVVVAALLLWAARSTALRLFLALWFALVFGDLAALAYLNTLYTEFSVLAGAYLAVGALVVAAVDTAPPRHGLAALAAFGLVWLGFAKQQYLGLAVVLAVLLALVYAWRFAQRGTAAGFVLLGCLLLLAWPRLNPPDRGLATAIDYANRTNTYLQAVLPAASDRADALRVLQLPAHCEKAVGIHWYTLESAAQHPCPEVRQVSRWRLWPLFLRDPATFGVPLMKGLRLLAPYYPDVLQRWESAQAREAPAARWVRWTSLSLPLAAAPPPLRDGIALLAAVLWLPLGLVALRQFARGRIGIPVAGAVLGSGMAFFALASSVFGDGYVDVPKHAVLFLPGLAAIGAALAVGVAQYLRARWPVGSAQRVAANAGTRSAERAGPSEGWAPRAAGRWALRAGVAIALALFLAALPRVAALGDKGLWSDELFSAALVERHPLVPAEGTPWFRRTTIFTVADGDTFWTAKGADQSPPLFELVAKLPVALAGHGDAVVLRSVSVAASLLLLLWLVLQIARERYAPYRAAYMLFWVMAASSAALVQYAQEARAYSLGVLFVGMLTLRLHRRLRAVDTDPSLPGWGEIAVFVAAGLTHYNALLLSGLFGAVYGVLALLRRDAGAVLRLAVVPLLIAPWLWLGAGGIGTASQGEVAFAPQLPLMQTLAAVSGQFTALTGAALPWAVILAVLVPPVAGWAMHTQPAATASALDRRTLMVCGILIGAYVMAAALIASRSGLAHPRHFLFVLPLCYLLAALAMATSVRATRARVVLAAILVATQIPVFSWYYRADKEGYREATQWVVARLGPDDLVLGAWTPNRNYYRYYLDRLGPGLRFMGVSSEADARAACDAMVSGGRFGLLGHVSHQPIAAALTKVCGERFALHGSFTVGDIFGQVWERIPSGKD